MEPLKILFHFIPVWVSLWPSSCLRLCVPSSFFSSEETPPWVVSSVDPSPWRPWPPPSSSASGSTTSCSLPSRLTESSTPDYNSSTFENYNRPTNKPTNNYLYVIQEDTDFETKMTKRKQDNPLYTFAARPRLQQVFPSWTCWIDRDQAVVGTEESKWDQWNDSQQLLPIRKFAHEEKRKQDEEQDQQKKEIVSVLKTRCKQKLLTTLYDDNIYLSIYVYVTALFNLMIGKFHFLNFSFENHCYYNVLFIDRRICLSIFKKPKERNNLCANYTRRSTIKNANYLCVWKMMERNRWKYT